MDFKPSKDHIETIERLSAAAEAAAEDDRRRAEEEQRREAEAAARLEQRRAAVDSLKAGLRLLENKIGVHHEARQSGGESDRWTDALYPTAWVTVQDVSESLQAQARFVNVDTRRERKTRRGETEHSRFNSYEFQVAYAHPNHTTARTEPIPFAVVTGSTVSTIPNATTLGAATFDLDKPDQLSDEQLSAAREFYRDVISPLLEGLENAQPAQTA